MSLENQVTRVSQGMKDTLKTLINKLGGNVTDELIDQYPELAASLAPITPASIGAAPAGYGLGVNTGKLITDGNDALVGGWFYWGNIDTNLPFTYGHLRVDPRLMGETSGRQTLMQTAYSDSYPGCVAQRKLADGVWKPWEWVNPPMKLGVEYRTTERYNGEAVYVTLNSDGTISKRTESGTDISPVTMDKVNTAISDAIGTVIGGSY